MKRIAYIGIMAAMVVVMMAAQAVAGDIIFSPGYSSVSAKAGDKVAINATISLVGAQSGPVTISGFNASGSAGTWIASSEFFVLNTQGGSSRNLTFALRVPADANSGNYTAVITPNVMLDMAGMPFDPMSPVFEMPVPPMVNSFLVNIDVVGDKCSAAPGFSGLTADTSTINVPNNKTYNVGISGKVTNPDGCTLSGAWYTLTDEYGELGGTVNIQPASDGSFSVSVPVKASRDGSDKDGRLYTISFGASNEAGTGSGGSLGVTVSHDQGKK